MRCQPSDFHTIARDTHSQRGMRRAMLHSTSSVSALSRHRRQHAHCAGMGVPILKTTGYERAGTQNDRLSLCNSRAMGMPVGDAEMRCLPSESYAARAVRTASVACRVRCGVRPMCKASAMRMWLEVPRSCGVCPCDVWVTIIACGVRAMDMRCICGVHGDAITI